MIGDNVYAVKTPNVVVRSPASPSVARVIHPAPLRLDCRRKVEAPALEVTSIQFLHHTARSVPSLALPSYKRQSLSLVQGDPILGLINTSLFCCVAGEG